MRSLCGGLMSAAPQRPGDDQRRLNAPLRQPHGDAANFLHRPTHQGGEFACVTLAADFFRARCWRGGESSPAWPRPTLPTRHDDASHARTWFRYGPAQAPSWPPQSPLRPPPQLFPALSRVEPWLLRPAMTLHRDQRLNRGASGTPGRDVETVQKVGCYGTTRLL